MSRSRRISLSELFKKSTATTSRTLWECLKFELVFRAFFTVVLTPLILWSISTLWGEAPLGDLSELDYPQIVTSLRGSLAFFLGLCLFALAFFWEQISLLMILKHHYQQETVRLKNILLEILSQTPHMLAAALGKTILYGLVLLPIGLFLLEGSFNFFLAPSPEFYLPYLSSKSGILVALASFFLAIFLVVIYIHWSFAFPLMVYQGTPLQESFQRSWHMVRSHRREVFKAYILAYLGFFFLILLIGGAFTWLDQLIISEFLQQQWILLPLIAFILFRNALVAGTLSLITTPLLMIFTSELLFKISPTPFRSSSASSSWNRLQQRIFTRGFATLCLLVFTIGSLLAIPSVYDQYQQLNRAPLIVAHRGAPKQGPGNHLELFKTRYKQGFKSFEVDLRRTQDGELIAFHDRGFIQDNGLEVLIQELSYQEIIATRDPIPPRLTELLNWLPEDGFVFLDLKDSDGIGQELLIEELKNRSLTSLAVMSFSPEALENIKFHHPELTTYLSSIGNLVESNRAFVDGVALEAFQLEAQEVRKLHREGKKVLSWTINDPERMQQLIGIGVDVMVTDRPELLKEQIHRASQLDKLERVVQRFLEQH